MVSTTHVPSIETSLAQVVTEGSKDKTLAWDT